MKPDTTGHVWRNTLTLLGAWVVGVSVLFILSLLWFDLITPQPNSYLGLFTFLIFPAFIVLGLVLVVLGLWGQHRRLRRRFGALSRLQYYPRFDFNEPGQRHVLAIVAAVAVFTVMFVGALSYRGYRYTDSTEFCGTVCHTVMAPQYVGHAHSSHARVECAACHVGEGASSYIKSKISGLRRVMAAATNSYSRPIPPAIRELRPAAETCEQCHWPNKFYGDQLVTKHRFAADEQSTPRPVQLLLKVGGSDPTAGPMGGIHWHMARSRSIEFVAGDEALQQISWIRVVDRKTGTEHVYRSDGHASSEPPPAGIHRVMDCMDCHNRTSHAFRSPEDAADSFLNATSDLRSLPFAKRELVAAVMRASEPSNAVSRSAGDELRESYRQRYAALAVTQQASVEALAAGADEIYRINFFPPMRVDWTSYPSNIGHLESAGCFRCHAGDQRDDAGNTITSKCDTCHEFITPAAEGSRSLVRSDEFAHPVELPGLHAKLACDRCHSAGALPEPTCEGCHARVTAFRAGTTAQFKEFGIEPEPMNGMVGCEDCHDVSEPVSIDTVQAACLKCHDEGEYGGKVKAWRTELTAKLSAVTPRDPHVRELVEQLRASGVLHNPDAARKILDALAASGAT